MSALPREERTDGQIDGRPEMSADRITTAEVGSMDSALSELASADTARSGALDGRRVEIEPVRYLYWRISERKKRLAQLERGLFLAGSHDRFPLAERTEFPVHVQERSARIREPMPRRTVVSSSCERFGRLRAGLVSVASVTRQSGPQQPRRSPMGWSRNEAYELG